MAQDDAAVVGDFYVTGGTLRADAPSYVSREADDQLFEALSRREFAYVLTSRQMGKSSLMVRTAGRLRDDGVSVVVLDLTALGHNLNADQWYGGLLTHVGQRLDIEDELEDFWYANERLGPLMRLIEAVRQVALPEAPGGLVVFVDEIDAVQSLPFPTAEFFAAIRECYTRRAEEPAFRALTFCLIGVATPSDLIDDPLTTPFNIGVRVEISDFGEAESDALASALHDDPDTAARLLRRVLHWTGGQPYLTQRLCHALTGSEDATEPADVDALCDEHFFAQRARGQDDNLAFVRNQMLRRDMDHEAILAVYADIRAGVSVGLDETNPSQSVLRLSGVVRVVDGGLHLRNRIYERVFDAAWISENMPDGELRRRTAQLATAHEDRGARLLADEDGAGLLYLVEAMRLHADSGSTTLGFAHTW
ncbi:MAG: AAA-like domain-containing protein, partial [Candidatus Poribacteria bacterium]